MHYAEIFALAHYVRKGFCIDMDGGGNTLVMMMMAVLTFFRKEEGQDIRVR
jgi:hypothetical protein